MGVGGRLSRGRGLAGHSPRGVAADEQWVAAGRWPRWPLAQRGLRSEGLLGRGEWAHLPGTRPRGGGAERRRRRRRPDTTTGARRARRRRGWPAVGTPTNACGAPRRAAFDYSLLFFPSLGRLPRVGRAPHELCISGLGTGTGGGGGRWRAHRVRDGATDGGESRWGGGRAPARSARYQAQQHTHGYAHPPPHPPPCTHTPRRNNASVGRGNDRRRGPHRPCPYGGREEKQQHASKQRGAVSRGPTPTVRTAGQPAGRVRQE